MKICQTAFLPKFSNLFVPNFSLKKEATSVQLLSELGDKWKSFDVIGIDEGQFYKDVSELFALINQQF